MYSLYLHMAANITASSARCTHVSPSAPLVGPPSPCVIFPLCSHRLQALTSQGCASFSQSRTIPFSRVWHANSCPIRHRPRRFRGLGHRNYLKLIFESNVEQMPLFGCVASCHCCPPTLGSACRHTPFSTLRKRLLKKHQGVLFPCLFGTVLFFFCVEVDISVVSTIVGALLLPPYRGRQNFRGSQLCVGNFAFQMGRQISHPTSRVFCEIGTCG